MTFNTTPPDPGFRQNRFEDVKYRISSFIRSFTVVVMAGMMLASIGLVMKFFALAGGDFVFVFSMAALSLLFLVQIGLSFFYVVTNVRLALLGAVSSVALVLGFLALIFRFQNWVGWQVMIFIALPLFIFSAVFMIRYLSRLRELSKQHRQFLYRNLLLPYTFILVLAILSAVLDVRIFNPLETKRLHDSPIDSEVPQDTSGMWRAY